MNSFPKPVYWRPLVLNAESLDYTTNLSFKNPWAPYATED